MARIAVHAARFSSGRARTVYVSTPVTTGRRFVDWRRGPGRALLAGSGPYRRHWRANVYERNVAHVRPLVEKLRGRMLDAAVVDPSALPDQPGWEQGDYHEFWTAFIREGADAVVMVDGWEYSVGCVFEYLQSLDCEVPVLDESLAPLPRRQALRRVEDAIDDLSRDSVLPVDGLLRARGLLHPHVGQSEAASA